VGSLVGRADKGVAWRPTTGKVFLPPAERVDDVRVVLEGNERWNHGKWGLGEVPNEVISLGPTRRCIPQERLMSCGLPR
jgi:hypothetical protein